MRLAAQECEREVAIPVAHGIYQSLYFLKGIIIRASAALPWKWVYWMSRKATPYTIFHDRVVFLCRRLLYFVLSSHLQVSNV